MSQNAIIFASLLGVSFLIGAVAARYVKNVADYYVAGARMPWYLLTATFVASNVSAGLFLGATNLAGLHGYAMWCSYFTTSIGFLLAIAVVGVLVRRLAGHYEIYDFADILAARYSSRGGVIRLLTAVFLPVIYIPLLAAQFIALTTIAAVTFDLSYDSLLTGIVILIIGYTMIGGMLGVVWSDGFQFLVLLFGLILAVPIGMASMGAGDPQLGWSQIEALSRDHFQWSTDAWPWQLVLGQFVWIFALPVQPHLVTRFLTARDERSILIALPVCLTIGLVIYASTVPVGLLGRLASPQMDSGGYFYLELARQHLGPWLGAFALAGISAAALSTSSTVLIVTGQSFSRELYQKWLAPAASERQVLIAARLGVLLVGILGFAIAYFQWLGIFWLVVLSASLLASVYFVPMIAGLFSIKASASGAIASMVAGGVAATAVFTINEIFEAHYFISELFAGLSASALAMWLFSRRRSATPAEREVVRRIRPFR
jgi:Na+/proline symporter